MNIIRKLTTFVPVSPVITWSLRAPRAVEESCRFKMSNRSIFNAVARSTVYPSAIPPAICVGPSVPSESIETRLIPLYLAMARAKPKTNS
jgi:hypothetical protein